MNAPTADNPGHGPPSPGPTPGADAARTSCKVRCRFAHGSNAGPGFTDEMSSLLRTRLRLAILIILAGFTLHFVRNLLLQQPAFDHRPLRLSIIGCEIVVLALVSALLWSRRPLSMRTCAPSN